ncbi:MAG: DUF4168 domain-containing protein [Drouetiella hepatica Uher 2000/2452]|jgi:hypothetical protein|uniref:DUF4168 domain-containing protein n=1 Tax=Drouetiella hepatica Uher 2000/2452 TaxID=904376 RepID=A0A951UPW2_9CYAN|nr:DUF4168 domain-containing protein [Drouetiella hepatica Uher 2000/2452]
MLKKILTSGIICAALTIASLPAQAQTQPTAPSDAPASGAPASGQSSDVSAQEVQQFADALKQMRSIHESAQTQANQIIEAKGLPIPRFNEILQSRPRAQAGTDQPNAPVALSTPVSEQEQQQFDQALTEITQLQQTTEQRMEQAITTTGLEVPRFNQIFSIARQDQTLKQRIEQVLQN